MKAKPVSSRPQYVFSGFARRMMIYLLLLSLLTVGILSIFFYRQEMERAFAYVEADLVKTLNTSGDQMDDLLNAVENVYVSLLRDRDLFQFFRHYEQGDLNTYTANETVSQVISNQTLHVPQVLSVQFLTRHWVFSENNTSQASIYNYRSSTVYQAALDSTETYHWMPTYDYTRAYDHTSLQDPNVPLRNRYVLSLVGTYDPFLYSREDFTIRRLPEDMERPVMVINVQEDVLAGILQAAQQTGYGEYFVIDDNGLILSCAEEGLLLTEIDAVQEISLGDHDEPYHIYRTEDGALIRIYYTTLSTGWHMVARVSETRIRQEIVGDIGGSMLIVASLVLVLCVLLGYVLSRSMTRPLNTLLAAITQTGQGHFDIIVPGTNNEFNTLIEAYNDMNRQIDRLIDENYAGKIRQKETQLLALKYQTNPHFLNNALTIIYLCGKREGSQKTAQLILSLSQMMQYVVRDGRDIVTLRDEINNVRQYMELIDVGYEGMIRCEFQVDEGLMNLALPKLCLQPLVENAVMHGLHGRKDGRIRIEAFCRPDCVLVRVQDNGEGMPPSFSVRENAQGEPTSIGLYNVHMRIVLLFGEGYGLEVEPAQAGACIVLRLPVTPVQNG